MGEILSSLSFARDEEGGYLIQYSRVVMAKVLFICALLCAWRGDRADLTCHVHKDNKYKDIIQQTCWSLGVYVYEELRNTETYGLPEDLKSNGLKQNGTLCKTYTRGGVVDPECKEMGKVFFKQYQYIHILLFLCVFLYFIPQVVLDRLDEDVARLKKLLSTVPQRPETLNITTKSSDISLLLKGDIGSHINKLCEFQNIVYKRKLNHIVQTLIDKFFVEPNDPDSMESYGSQTFRRFHHPIRLLFLLTYGFLNLIPLSLIHCIHNGHFLFYGSDWLNQQLATWWSDSFPAPDTRGHYGNMFLPPLALCDVTRLAGKDDVGRLHFTKLLCEVNQHAQLQVVYLVLWTFLMLGCLLSPLHCVVEIVDIWRARQTYTIVCRDFKTSTFNSLNLTVQQLKYFVLVHRTHRELATEIVVKLSLGLRQRADYRQLMRGEGSQCGGVREKDVRDSLDTALLRRNTLRGIEEVEVDMDEQNYSNNTKM